MERKMGPSVRRKGKMKIFPLSLCPKACFSSLRKWEKRATKVARKENRETTEERNVRLYAGRMGNESFPLSVKLPRLSFLTSSLSPSLQSKLINDDDEEEKEKRKKQGNKQ